MRGGFKNEQVLKEKNTKMSAQIADESCAEGIVIDLCYFSERTKAMFEELLFWVVLQTNEKPLP